MTCFEKIMMKARFCADAERRVLRNASDKHVDLALTWNKHKLALTEKAMLLTIEEAAQEV